MKYGIEVKTRGGWERLRPSGGEPYEFATEEQAESAARMCHPGYDGYPTSMQTVRVVTCACDAAEGAET